MNRDEFEEIRKLPSKEIAADIEFVRAKGLPNDIVVFDSATVKNSLGIDVYAGGQYNRKTKRITYHFTLREIGKQICRVDVRGQVHGSAGRTHKHELMKESDPYDDLPFALPRPELEKLTPRALWEIVCRQAGIDHTGNFTDP